MSAVLTNEQNDIDKLAIAMEECDRMGLNVLPPDINESFVEFGVVKETRYIRFALAAIKGVGAGISENIVEERSKNGRFKNLADFVVRTVGFGLNKKTMDGLIRSGALDDFGNRASMLNSMELILKYARDAGRVKAMGQTDIFGVMSEDSPEEAEEYHLEIPELPEVSKKELLGWEKELMGMYLSDHPLGEYKNYFLKHSTACRDLTLDMEGQKVTVGGIITKVHKIVTKKGDPMAFITIEDLSDNVEIIVFPKVYEKNQEMWEEGKIVLVEGKINTKDSAVKVLVDKYKEVSSAEAESVLDEDVSDVIQSNAEFYEIKIKSDLHKDRLEGLKEILLEKEGNTKVKLIVFVHGEERKILTDYKIDLTSEIKNEIHTILNG